MRVNTICPNCDGAGEVRVARAAGNLVGDAPNKVGTAWPAERCNVCKGTGKLSGFQAPV